MKLSNSLQAGMTYVSQQLAPLTADVRHASASGVNHDIAASDRGGIKLVPALTIIGAGALIGCGAAIALIGGAAALLIGGAAGALAGLGVGRIIG